MRELWKGEYVTFRGARCNAERARFFDLAESPIPISVATAGRQATSLATTADKFLAFTSPVADLMGAYNKVE